MQLVLEGKVKNSGKWAEYKRHAEEFICACIQKGSYNVNRTPGGLLWFLPWNNVQYIATAALATTVYSIYLGAKHASLNCPARSSTPSDLIASIKSQVGYILGVSNLINMSYMVGFGNGGNYPKQIHHRGASMISIKKDAIPVTCKGGFEEWFHKNAPNPNVLDGAVVPTTVTDAPLVGVFAHFA